MNDFPSCLECTSCNLFADDTVIYCSGKTVPEINATLQSDVDKAIKWFHDNKLTVNIEKSCAITIGTQQRLKNQTEQLSISIGNENLSLVETIKYLGVTIDDNISWNQHVNNLCSKILPRIELLLKLNTNCPLNN